MIAGSVLLCLCHYRPALLRFWFQTDLRRKNSTWLISSFKQREILVGFQGSSYFFDSQIFYEVPDIFPRLSYRLTSIMLNWGWGLLWDLKSPKVALSRLKSPWIIQILKRFKLSRSYYFFSFLLGQCMISDIVCNNPCSIILATDPPHPPQKTPTVT